MKNFIEKHPFWFSLIFMIIVTQVLGFAAVLFTAKVIGLPVLSARFAAVLITTIVPLWFIWRIGWWEDSGLVGTVQNSSALTVPVVKMFLPLYLFGTVATESGHAMMLLLLVIFTGISEEAIYRGLFIRALLPQGKWQAVLLSSGLFAASHIAQSIGGNMGLDDNLTQIANAFFGGVLYSAVRLRINSLWPLIIIHAIYDLFFVLAGFFDGAYQLSDIPMAVYFTSWGVSIATALYLMQKPVTATLDGKPVG